MKKVVLIAIICSIFSTLTAQNQTTNKRYYLILSARGINMKPFSLTGHAFITWSTQQDADTMVECQTLGFYPNHEATVYSTIFEKNKGSVEKGFDKNKNDTEIEQLIIEVDSLTWAKSQQVETKWKKKNYNLLSSNCVAFADRVMAFTKLKRSKTKIWNLLPITPIAYLRSLIRKNQNKFDDR